MGRRRAARLAKQSTPLSPISDLPGELWVCIVALVDLATLPALRLSCTHGRTAVEVAVRDLRKVQEHNLFLRVQSLHQRRLLFKNCHVANATASTSVRAWAWVFLDRIFEVEGILDLLCKELGFDSYFKTLLVGVALWLEAFIKERVFRPDEESYLYSLDRDRGEGKSWTKATLLGLRTSGIFWHASASVGYTEEWDLFMAEKLPTIVVEPSMHKKLLFEMVWSPERAALKYMAYVQHAKNHAGIQVFAKLYSAFSGSLAPRFQLQEHWFTKARRRRGLHPAPPLQIVPFQG